MDSLILLSHPRALAPISWRITLGPAPPREILTVVG